MENFIKTEKFFIIFLIIMSFATSCSDSLSDKTIDTTIPGPSGRLFVTLEIPKLKKNEKCPMVILMHGIFSNRNTELMTMIANKLKAEGIASIRLDFNGHGESDGDFQNMTVANEVADAKAVYEYAKSLDCVSSISLLGHSQGGVVASLLAGELGNEKIKNVVLMAPAAVLEDQAKEGTTLGQKFDPNDIPEYLEVFGHKIGREYFKVAQNLNIYENAAKYKGQVYIIHGIKDFVVPYTYAEKYNDVYNDSKLSLLENEDHSFDKEKEKTTDLVANFFANTLIKSND